MYLLYVIVAIISLSFLLNQLFTIFDDYKQRQKMKSVEQKLEKAGVTPYGSTLSHGMYINTSKNKLVADQKQSAVWYKRLT